VFFLGILSIQCKSGAIDLLATPAVIYITDLLLCTCYLVMALSFPPSVYIRNYLCWIWMNYLSKH